MENKSVQDILDVDVEAIVDQGKKAKKRRKQMLIKEGIAGIVLLCSIFWFAQTKNIREVEEAIENIEIENLCSITHNIYSLRTLLEDFLSSKRTGEKDLCCCSI